VNCFQVAETGFCSVSSVLECCSVYDVYNIVCLLLSIIIKVSNLMILDHEGYVFRTCLFQNEEL